MATDYNSVMDSDDVEDDYDLDDDLDDEEGENGLMGNGLKKKIIAGVVGVIVIFGVIFSLWAFAGGEDEAKVEAPAPRASSQDGGAAAGQGASGLGLSGSNGNSIELTNTIKAFGNAVYTGDGRAVYNMTSQRCRSSVGDAQAFADSYAAQAGKAFKVKDLEYRNEEPRLGVAFVTYEVKGNKSATLNVYFIWDRGTGAWVMDSCNL